MRNAIRRAADKSGAAARKIALDIIAKDIGVPKARIKDRVSKVKHPCSTSRWRDQLRHWRNARVRVLPTRRSGGRREVRDLADGRALHKK
jgi:hypothetical protein